MFLEDGSQDVSEIVVIDGFVGKCVVFFGICTHIFFRSHNRDVPLMRSLYIMLNT